MADARIAKRERVVTEECFVLELTRDEAAALIAVLRRVAGFCDTTRRGHTESVYRALRFYMPEQDRPGASTDLEGQLIFRERAR